MHAAAAVAGARRAASQRGLRQPLRPAEAQGFAAESAAGWAEQGGGAYSAEGMEVGTDDGISALGYQESKGGKSLADTKVRYSWALSLDGRVYHIDFTNSKTSGKKRVFVDGRLQSEQKVYRSPTFQYSWPLGTHLLSIVPKQSEATTSVFGQLKKGYNDKVDCAFELRINGLPFHSFGQAGGRATPFAEEQPQQGRPPSRPMPAAEEEFPFAAAQRDREYAEMQRRVEEVRQRGSDQAASARSRAKAPSVEEADPFNTGPARSLTPSKRRERQRPNEGQANAGRTTYSNLADDRISDSSDEEADEPFFRYAAGANTGGRSPSAFASSLFGKRSSPPRSPKAAPAAQPAGASPWNSFDQRPKATSSPNPWGEFEGFGGFPSGTAPADANSGSAAFASQEARAPDRPAGGGAVDPWGATLPQDPWGRAAQATPQSPPTPSRTSQGLSAIRKTVPTQLLPWQPKGPGRTSQIEKQGFLESEGVSPSSAEQHAPLTGDDDVDVEEQLAILASLEASRADSPVQASEPLLGASTPSQSPQKMPVQTPTSDAWRNQANAPDPWGSASPVAAAPQVSEAPQWPSAAPSAAPDPWGSAAPAALSNEPPPSTSPERKPLPGDFSDPWGSAVSTAAPSAHGGDRAPLLSGSVDPWGSFPSKEASPGEQSSPLLNSASDPWSSFGLPAVATASAAAGARTQSQADPWGGLPAVAQGSSSQADPWATSSMALPAAQVADPWATLSSPAAAPYPSAFAAAAPSMEGYATLETNGTSPVSEAEADPWSSFGGPAVASAVPPKAEGYGKLPEDAASPTSPARAPDPWGSFGPSTPGATQPASFGSPAPHASVERWPPW